MDRLGINMQSIQTEPHNTHATAWFVPSCNVRIVPVAVSLCLICLAPGCRSWCERWTPRKHLISSHEKCGDDRRVLQTRQVALHLLWNDATNHHSAMCLNAQTHSNRWRLIMWLKGTAAVSRLLTIRVRERKHRWHRVPVHALHRSSCHFLTATVCGKNLYQNMMYVSIRPQP